MKKTILFLSFALLIALQLPVQAGSLKNVVAIVRPVYSETSVKFLNDFSVYLTNQGYNVSANILKSYAKGGFGSGFACKNAIDGKVYILTNKHVIAQAQSATIEFMMDDQSVKSFNKCKIVAIDDVYDLALIQLPDEAVIENPLEFAATKPDDGTDVFTAGYPGLNSNPSWQLGKGIISNNNLHIDELSTGKSGVIQHTAQIDAGSSGGPLMVKDPNAARGYQIVGMNSWKAEGRENVNLAIPSSAINEFMSKYNSAADYQTKEILQKRVASFVGVAKDGYKSILPYISYDYVGNVSVNSFFRIYNAATKDVRELVSTQFKDGFPIEGVRLLIADAISRKLAKKGIAFATIEQFSTTDPVLASILLDGKSVDSKWIQENGSWRLTSFSGVNINGIESGSIATDYGYSTKFSFSSNKGANSLSYNEFLYGNTIYTFISYELGVVAGNSKLVGAENAFSKYLGVEFVFGGQLPVRVGPIFVVPYLKGFGGMDIGDAAGPAYGFKLGTEIAFHLVKDSYIILGMGLNRKLHTETMDGKVEPLSALALHFGITY